jgi:hypothetical protein
VTLTITLPDGTTDDLSPTNPPSTTGQYFHDYQTVQAGRHSARWLGTGTNPGAHSDAFDVRVANPPYIVSLADVRDQLNMTSTADDEELRTYIEATTAVVENYLGRAVVRRSFTEEHQVSGGELMLNWTPVQSITSIETVDGVTTWTAADVHVSTSGVVTAEAGATALDGAITVTYVAGSALVPGNWALAARIIVQHLWETQRGTAGAPFAGGLDMPGAGFTQYGFSIPNRAKQLLTGGVPGL